MISLPQNVEHVLIAPLNWGLGHATRCIPIIDNLLDQGLRVSIASDGEALELLKEAYPTLNTYSLPSYNIEYRNGMWSNLLTNMPRFIKAVRNERKAIKQIVEKDSPDLIISDCRFGLKHDNVVSYIISHQLTIQSDSLFLKKVLNYFNKKLLNSFDKCIVPDYSDHKLAGSLSQNANIRNKEFIGPLSRMTLSGIKPKYFLAVILSGPEPTRTQFEKKVIQEISSYNKNMILVRGTTRGPQFKNDNSNLTIIKRANTEQVNNILLSSKYVVSRSGYSSIMDYDKLHVKAILVPTPHQPEQEYLANYLNFKFGFRVLMEENLNHLSSLLKEKTTDFL